MMLPNNAAANGVDAAGFAQERQIGLAFWVPSLLIVRLTLSDMKPIDPSPYLVVYGVLVFLLPWLIYVNFIVRGLLYARKRGISLFSKTASDEIRALRQTDSHASLLHRRAWRWFFITLAMWPIGFAIMCVTLFLLHQHDVV